MEADDVGVPLAHDDLVGVGDVGLRPVEPVQGLRLGVDRRLRRVLVLRRIGRARQHPPTDRHGLAGVGEDREQHAPPEGVLHAIATVGERQSGRPQQLAVDAGTSYECVPVVRRPAQLERPGDVPTQPARAEVVARRPRRRVIEQRAVVPLDRPAHRLDKLLAPCPLTRLASGGVGELHPHLGRQILDGADEVDVLVLLHEREHVARLVAAEALVPAGLLTDVERGRPLGVERAQPDPVASGLAQGDELADDVDDRHRRAQPLDVVVSDRHGARVRPAARSESGRGSSRIPTRSAPRLWPGMSRAAYLVSDDPAPTMAWAAARRAIGTRNGEQLT